VSSSEVGDARPGWSRSGWRACCPWAGCTRQNTTKASEALKYVKTAYPKDSEAAKLVDSIQKHYAKVLIHCDMLDECCKTTDGIAKLGDCCADVQEESEAAKLETDKLMKLLKIDPLPVLKKDSAKK
ncbi:MAG: hypothetical protein IAG10_23820, partial [Planctomycetaceae bacterium]|nr:hypothetical protein [Planctomycetaceae bacterium]